MATLHINDLYILLVEPSNAQRKYIIKHLQDAKIGSVTGVVTGGEALASMKKDLPDLVISTMYFPDMTGIDLVTEMRKNLETQGVPFMLISSESSYLMLESIRQAGVVAILPKPFTDEDLSRALAATLDYIEPGGLNLEFYEVEELRVLLVDDSNSFRNFICKVIEEMGFQEENITLAKDGKEALEYFEIEEFDLVITDLNMPVMDGDELIEHIRNDSVHSGIPILMVTSESDSAKLEHVQQAGVSAICDKPFQPTNIKQLLAQIMNN
ncbi:MAG: two-component system response regulator [Gammaproteobacteria bacterium]|nr:MAG: two-component system response regulator [Gammaproteobacteria bacterium]